MTTLAWYYYAIMLSEKKKTETNKTRNAYIVIPTLHNFQTFCVFQDNFYNDVFPDPKSAIIALATATLGKRENHNSRVVPFVGP